MSWTARGVRVRAFPRRQLAVRQGGVRVLCDKRSVEMEGGDVVEPGQPVRPGDTLALAQPFVFAIQPQYRQKVCENCLLL